MVDTIEAACPTCGVAISEVMSRPSISTRIESTPPINSINDSPASRPTAPASSGEKPSCRAFQATARYIAPVLMKRYPSRRATARAIVLLPAPAGPSMAMINPLSANQNLPNDLKRPLDLFATHVVMRHHSHLSRVRSEEHTSELQS